MAVERFGIGGPLRLKVMLLFPGQEGWPPDIPDLFIQDAGITRNLDVPCHRKGQPEEVVREPGADPAAGRRVPPVEDVPLRELVGVRPQQVGPCLGRVGVQ